jgi:hypothetical protein
MQSTGHKADLQAEKAEKAVKLSGENWGEIGWISLVFCGIKLCGIE